MEAHYNDAIGWNGEEATARQR